MPDNKTRSKIKKNIPDNKYFEVYIEENGDLVFNYLTRETASIFKKISDSGQITDSIYCG